MLGTSTWAHLASSLGPAQGCLKGGKVWRKKALLCGWSFPWELSRSSTLAIWMAGASRVGVLPLLKQLSASGALKGLGVCMLPIVPSWNTLCPAAEGAVIQLPSEHCHLLPSEGALQMQFHIQHHNSPPPGILVQENVTGRKAETQAPPSCSQVELGSCVSLFPDFMHVYNLDQEILV